jgi:GTP cyclohydrolase II
MTLPAEKLSALITSKPKLRTWPDEEAYFPLRIVAQANLPSRHGSFKIIAFSPTPDGKEHIAMVHGDLRKADCPPVRLHSECLTGDVMGSLRCDCREQLEASLKYIAEQEAGAVIYLRQEGRGIGLANKLRAYVLQERGLDTVDANHALGFDDDERDYRVAAEMLKALGVSRIKLLSNNPRKIKGLELHNIEVVERIPIVLPTNEHNEHYLHTKAERSGHLIQF